MAALATLLIAYVAWVLCQLAIDRHLQDVAAGPKLPGTDDDSESAPGSRLQTMLLAAFMLQAPLLGGELEIHAFCTSSGDVLLLPGS
jgi:hypothetical protein